jgi:hypothetical protein
LPDAGAGDEGAGLLGASPGLAEAAGAAGSFGVGPLPAIGPPVDLSPGLADEAAGEGGLGGVVGRAASTGFADSGPEKSFGGAAAWGGLLGSVWPAGVADAPCGSAGFAAWSGRES